MPVALFEELGKPEASAEAEATIVLSILRKLRHWKDLPTEIYRTLTFVLGVSKISLIQQRMK